MDDLLNTAPCGFLSFAEDGKVVDVNATLLEMLGYQADDVVGRHVEQILTIGGRIFYQTHWFPLLRLHGRAEEIFLLLRASNGEDVGVLVNAARRERDGLIFYDCVLMRVRERRKYEEELLRAKQTAEEARSQAQEANRAKSTFLAVMSHELRTPLNAIAGYVQILDMGIHGPVTEAQREALDRIERSESHLLRLIDAVLDLSRIEAGRVEYAIEDVPVAEVISAVAPMVEPQFAAASIDFAVDVEPALAIRADREKVQQILINLLGNAAKFTPAGGRVVVEARPSSSPDPSVLLRVSDTGPGIPPGKFEAIFQPFTQVDPASVKAAEGFGLGLAISRDLARGMGGDLVVFSENGQGSTFTLSLPVPSREST